MLQSIKDDIKKTFQHGNMVNKLLIANISVFVIVILFKVFMQPFDGVYEAVLRNLQISSDPVKALLKPWTFITHMFLHVGVWHIVWNMILLYWFGKIVGDLIGDSKVLSIYIYGGLVGGLIFILYFNLTGVAGAGYAHGASAAVMAMVMVAALVAPDYNMRLLLIGDVKIKYIALAMIILDLAGTAGDSNTGGHFAHLGGVFFGWFFVYSLRSGNDLSIGLNKLIAKGRSLFETKKEVAPKSPLKVKYKAKNFASSARRSKGTRKSDNDNLPFQEKLDAILEKIKAKGYENLSDEEKEFLFQASKK